LEGDGFSRAQELQYKVISPDIRPGFFTSPPETFPALIASPNNRFGD
jgi:hypothetical protein